MAFPFMAAATIGAGLISAFSSAKTNKAQKEVAQSQMDFQRDMSNTAHQREVEDLRLAGLNPILSVNSGASTPLGAMPVLQNPYNDFSADVNSAFRLGMEKKMNKALIDTEASKQAVNVTQAEKNIIEKSILSANAVSAQAEARIKQELSQAWTKSKGVGRHVATVEDIARIIGSVGSSARDFGIAGGRQGLGVW